MKVNKVLLKSKYVEIVLDVRSWGIAIDFNTGIDMKVYRPVIIQILCFYFDLGIDPLQEYEDEREKDRKNQSS